MIEKEKGKALEEGDDVEVIEDEEYILVMIGWWLGMILKTKMVFLCT